MLNGLFPLLKRPALWQRSEAKFWDDDNISKYMLEAHLNPGWDAASRKLDTIERSVAWLSTVIPAGAKLLDLGCGPGLYTQRLSALGYDVTGMDFSRRSIAYAKEHDPKTRYVYGNYLELDEAERYDAITLIYADYAALTEGERKTLLSLVRRALKPGGLFICDVFTPVNFAKKSENKDWQIEKSGFWSDQPNLCLEATYLYEGGRVAADCHTVVTEQGATEHIIWDTSYTKEQLTEEIEAGGLTVEQILSDVCGAPYSPDSETLCCVARK